MGALEWLTSLVGAPSCKDLAKTVRVVADPGAFLRYGGGAHVWENGPPSFFTDAGEAAPGQYDESKLPVSRAVATAQDAPAIASLLVAAYKYPDVVRVCPIAKGWADRGGQVRSFAALGKYLATGAPVDAATASTLADAFTRALTSKVTAEGEELIYTVARAVYGTKTPVVDAAVWIPLWRWAIDNRATPRARVMALQAIQSIIARGSLSRQQILMASSMVDALEQLVIQRASDLPAGQRDVLIAAAEQTVAIMQQAKTPVLPGPPGLTPPPGPPPGQSASVLLNRYGKWIATGAAVTVAAVALGFIYRRRMR